MTKFKTFREDYPEFIYKSFELSETDETVNIKYNFEITDLAEFSPQWKIKKSNPKPVTLDPVLRKLAFSLGMVELVSYWKIACPPTVYVEAGVLDAKQIAWWKNLYYHGLGEFFYTNGIEPDAETFMTIQSMGQEEAGVKMPLTNPKGCLIPVGGGKDSVVTIELLKQSSEPTTCYIINPRGATIYTTEVGGYTPEQVMSVKRTLGLIM